jgi:hypothetical protein
MQARTAETAKPADVKAPAAEATAAAATPSLSQEEQAAARDALRRKMQQAEASSPHRNGEAVHPQLPTVESKFPRSKAQRLADLLEKYRHDEITPAEYHSQRAKILTEPNQ